MRLSINACPFIGTSLSGRWGVSVPVGCLVLVAVGVVGALGVAVAVDEDPVLFGDLSLTVFAALGPFGGDQDGSGR
jgi:hypothetical protein